MTQHTSPPPPSLPHSPTLTTSSHLPTLHHTPRLTTTLAQHHRTAHSLANRLRSIAHDAAFVRTVARAWALGVLGNERCGAWYVDLDVNLGTRRGEGREEMEKATVRSCYFKSTDGHYGNWGFSLRRGNLGVLRLVREEGGCIIVDSTRRGKKMPDALSKTIPIWCAVLNRVLFPFRPETHELHTPPRTVSRQEHAQIEERLWGFVGKLLELHPPVPPGLTKPLRPLWITPSSESSLPSSPPDLRDLDFSPLVLCTASQWDDMGDLGALSMSAKGWGDGYVQGAGDDAEGWAGDLTPSLFWKHHDVLLRTSNDELLDLIKNLVAGRKTADQSRSTPGRRKRPPRATLIRPTTNLYLGPPSMIPRLVEEEGDIGKWDVIILCTPPGCPLPTSLPTRLDQESSSPVHPAHPSQIPPLENTPPSPLPSLSPHPPQKPKSNEYPNAHPTIIHLPCRPSKQGVRDLRPLLPVLKQRFSAALKQSFPSPSSYSRSIRGAPKIPSTEDSQNPEKIPRVLITSSPESDLAIGVGLVVGTLFFDEGGECLSISGLALLAVGYYLVVRGS
ncbi:MAG: hypothetical protein M1817_006397 [Caeruleum heppii]|nr:MAG: hypothetical protein M1817_006397 [Caeruleum heppii]